MERVDDIVDILEEVEMDLHIEDNLATVGAKRRNELRYLQLSPIKQPLPPIRTDGSRLPTITVDPSSRLPAASVTIEVVVLPQATRQTTLSTAA